MYPIHWLTPKTMVTYAARGRGVVGILTDGSEVSEKAKDLAAELSMVSEMRAFIDQLEAVDLMKSNLTPSQRIEARRLLWLTCYHPQHGDVVLRDGQLRLGEKD